MAVTPTGMFSAPIGSLATLLSVCEAFQTFVGVAAPDIGQAAGIAEALAKVHLYQFDEPAKVDDDATDRINRQAYRPMALVGYEDGLSGGPEDSGSYWHKSGPLFLMFEGLARNDTGPQTDVNTVTTDDAVVYFMNHIGAIIEECEAKVISGGYLNISGWTMKNNPGRMHADDVAVAELDIVTVTFQIDRSDM